MRWRESDASRLASLSSPNNKKVRKLPRTDCRCRASRHEQFSWCPLLLFVSSLLEDASVSLLFFPPSSSPIHARVYVGETRPNEWMDGDGHIHLTGLGYPPNINSLTVTNTRCKLDPLRRSSAVRKDKSVELGSRPSPGTVSVRRLV